METLIFLLGFQLWFCSKYIHKPSLGLFQLFCLLWAIMVIYRNINLVCMIGEIILENLTIVNFLVKNKFPKHGFYA
jgi:hypothetical protein